MDDFARSYQILGVRPEDSWHKLRAAYKSAVRKWHPDRYSPDDPERQRAEERIKEINRAYQELESYYNAFGVLPPLTEDRQDEPPAAAPQPAPQSATTATDSASNVNDRTVGPAGHDADPHNRWLPWVIAALLMLLGYILTSPEDKDPALEAPNTPQALDPPDPAAETAPPESGKYLTVGLTLDQVYALLGTPTRTSKNHESTEWRYGDALVFFRDGRVTDWIDSPDHRLAAVNAAAPATAEKPKTFQLNSTREEVRAAQGAPIRETDTLWEYGLSQVFFQHDRVVGWYESPLHPLRLRRDTPAAAPDGASVPN